MADGEHAELLRLQRDFDKHHSRRVNDVECECKMKRLLAILALTPLLGMGQFQVGQRNFTPASGGGGHAMTLVQGVDCPLAGGGAGPAYTCSFNATPVGASVLIACAATVAGITITPTPTSLFTSGITGNDQLGIISGISTGTTSIGVTLAGAYTYGACEIGVVTGVVTSSPVDVTNPTPTPIAAARSPYSASINTGSVTTTNATDAIVGVAMGGGQSLTVGAGYTLISQAATYVNVLLEFQNVSATGAYNPPVTQSAAGYSDIGTVGLKLQ